MSHATPVRRVQPARDLQEDRNRVLQRKRPSSNAVRQSLAFDMREKLAASRLRARDRVLQFGMPDGARACPAATHPKRTLKAPRDDDSALGRAQLRPHPKLHALSIT